MKKEENKNQIVAPKQSTEPTNQSNEAKPQKSKKRGCCIVALIIFVLIMFMWLIFPFLGIALFGGLFGGDDAKDSKVSTPVTTNDTTTKNKDQAKTSDKTASNSDTNSENSYSFTREQFINYFVEATTYSTKKQATPLQRFTKNIIYLKVIGTIPNQESEETLNRVIADFNSLSETSKIERNDNGEDILAYFIPGSEFINYSNTTNTEAFEVDVPNADCSIKYAKVFIANDEASLNQPSRKYAIRHEITHALGFIGHINDVVNSILYSRVDMEHYTELDSKLIKMMYNTGVPLCSNESGVRTFFQNWNP